MHIQLFIKNPSTAWLSQRGRGSNLFTMHKIAVAERVVILDNGENSIGKWISVLYRSRKIYASRMLEPYGLAGCQYLYIMTLQKHNGASQEKISDCLKIDKTTTAKAIKKLEDNGFVVRDINLNDKRANKVYLTQKALDIIPCIEKVMERWENIFLSDISDDEHALLERLLHHMAVKAISVSNS